MVYNMYLVTFMYISEVKKSRRATSPLEPITTAAITVAAVQKLLINKDGCTHEVERCRNTKYGHF